MRWCLQRGREGREGGRKASGKAGASFKSPDEQLLPGILRVAPRAMQTRIKIPNFQVCFKKFTYFQASLKQPAFLGRNKYHQVLCVEDKRYQRLSGEPFYLSASTQRDRAIQMFAGLMNGRACVELIRFTGPFTGEGYRNHNGINEILLAKFVNPR